MAHATDTKSRIPLARLAAGKWVLWLTLMLFCWQLFASTQHHHDLGKHAPDCASCVVAAQPAAGGGNVDVQTDPASTPQLWFVIAPPARYAFAGPVSFLIPHGQAPPPRSPNV